MRAMPISRPLGLTSQRPPAVTTAICAAQQLPKPGTLASKAALAKSICGVTLGSSAKTVRLEPVQAMPSY